MAMLLHIIHLRLLQLFKLVRFRSRLVKLALTLRPIAGADEGDGDGDGEGAGDAGDGEGDDDDEGEGAGNAGDGEGDDDDEGEGAGNSRREPNWKQMSRKHEREAKKHREEAAQLRKRLKAREDMDKSETEKKIEEAEQRARNETEQKYETERRHDRLELATTKLAAKGVTIGTGKEAKTVKFADPDDAIVYLERAISNGDVEQDDVFDDNGKVRSDQLEEALADVLERKPHLAAGDKPATKVKGSADAGKGTTAAGEDTVDAQLNKIRRHSSSKGEEGARYRKAA